MDNKNKETEFDPSNLKQNVSQSGLDSENEIGKIAEEEFDPSESEAFYNNLDAVFGASYSDSQTGTKDALLDDDLFLGVDAALAEQIEHEFNVKDEVSSTQEKQPNKIVSAIKRMPTWTKVLVSVFLVLVVSIGLLFGTKGGRSLIYKALAHMILSPVPVDPDSEVTTIPELTVTIVPTITPESTITPALVPDETLTPEPTQDPEGTTEVTVTPTITPTPTPVIVLMDDKDVINVLLLGEENIHGASKGRTDAIILASVNLNGGPLKLVSFMRDMYVDIPGREEDDRLNAAYAYGGAPLIVETIEKNFGVDIDGYVIVNFAGFENIIDELGGLDISLTARESEYLNTTKYISKPEERNTVPGSQHMTGSQVLGYCRVRYVPTAEGLTDDRGRNYRHRVVLKALVNKFKDKKVSELLSVMNSMFGYVKRSADLDKIAADCLQTVVENKMFDISTMQMPMSGTYKDLTVISKDGTKKAVISYFPSNVDYLQDFLYEDE